MQRSLWSYLVIQKKNKMRGKIVAVCFATFLISCKERIKNNVNTGVTTVHCDENSLMPFNESLNNLDLEDTINQIWMMNEDKIINEFENEIIETINDKKYNCFSLVDNELFNRKDTLWMLNSQNRSIQYYRFKTKLVLYSVVSFGIDDLSQNVKEKILTLSKSNKVTLACDSVERTFIKTTKLKDKTNYIYWNTID